MAMDRYPSALLLACVILALAAGAPALAQTVEPIETRTTLPSTLDEPEREAEDAPEVLPNQGRTAIVGGTLLGQRQNLTPRAGNTLLYRRLETRIDNRVQNRLRTRIDRSYDPQANARNPFALAEGEATQQSPD
jgi:hypothetical protein|tara:strand:- start:4970 stop:5371 length:402 start_codon:yes stop_codon:yes gene_type:complete